MGLKRQIRYFLNSSTGVKLYSTFYRTYGLLKGRKVQIPVAGTSSEFQLNFIVGSGRSGNTLLRAMLIASGQVAIPPEFYVLPQMIKTFYKMRHATWEILVDRMMVIVESNKDFETFRIDTKKLSRELIAIPPASRSLQTIVLSIYFSYQRAAFPGASVIADKTPLNTLNLFWIDSVFPDAKYIHLLRDGRAVSYSYLKAGLYPSLTDAATRWKDSIRYFAKFRKSLENKKQDNRLHLLKYEDLVSNTQDELIKACNFFNIDYVKQMHDYQNVFAKLGDTSKHKHHENVGKPINQNSIDKWRQKLSTNEKDILNNLLKKDLEECGYEK